MPMESKVAKLIELAEIITDIQGQTEDTPIILRHTDEKTGQTVAIACGQVEPTDIVLPLNVLWFNYDVDSPLYRRALKRVSKQSSEPNSISGLTHSWTDVYFYSDVFEPQYFDQDDLDLFDMPEVPVATVEQIGKTQTATAPIDAQQPVVIGTTDPRMADSRDPLSHSHPEVPATKVLSGTNVLDIIDQSAPMPGFTMHFNSSGEIIWAQLKETDIEAGGYRG